MKFKKLRATTLVVLSVLLLTFSAAMAQSGYWYDPTGDETDAKFLTVAGPDLETLIDQPISVYIIVPAGQTNFEIGIFDGDTRGTDTDGKEHWDSPGGSEELIYKLYADPYRTGDVSMLIGTWFGNADNMPDNDWFNIVLPTHAQAMGPEGYTYRLVAGFPPTILEPKTASRFKLRSTAPLVVGADSAFTFEAPITGFPDLEIIYPGWPYSLDPSSYDGEWIFKIYVKGADPTYEVNEVTVWDGDLDHGSVDGIDQDTDDPDTPSIIPPWAAPGETQEEGAMGIGQPADNGGVFYLVRNPSIEYEVIDPDGVTVWTNPNPSGNREWERFTIRSITHPDGCIAGVNADYCTGVLKQGIYTVKVKGVDLNNLNAFYFPYQVMSPTAGSIGDYIWFDLNCDGIQDTDEVGIEGVTVNLYADGNPDPVATTTTDAVGFYLFPNLLPGNYTVEVDESTLPPGLTLTTANEPHTAALAKGQDYTDADFGYCETLGGYGCTPGYWKQKQHFDSWESTPYRPGDSFADVFGVQYEGKTLLEALSTGGGKEKALGRHAVAALLNAAALGVSYYYTEQEIISMVQQAWATGDYETAKNLLAEQNEMGCPLN